ncbi:hypothetical protein C6500_20670 [Candidatus Poribacteria bacterium]|nr:MAG: hypothetical protein C6500_20670 [Candidatus Poribacteria bacterium]
MNRIFTTTPFVLIVGLTCLSLIGCASLYQPLPKRIAASHLSCEAYPRLVDGNLATTGILKVKGMVEKDYIGGITQRSITTARRYGDWLEGRNKAEAWIQLDTLTSVAYIEVHPVSNIYRLLVYSTTVETQPGQSEHLFEPVKSHKIARSENGAVIRIDIDRPVRWLRIVIHANRDPTRAEREPLTQKIKVPFEDIVIREVRFYAQHDGPAD